MPCRDFYDDHPEAYFRDVKEPALKKQIAFAESALCATLDAFQRELHKDENVFDYIDYKSAGITREELEKWRIDHKALDEKHREEAKKRALAKLTQEEKELLGLK